MADRSVTVRLSIDISDYTRGLAQAAAATKAFQNSLKDSSAHAGDMGDHLDSASSSARDVSSSTKDIDSNMSSASASTASLSKNMDRTSKSLKGVDDNQRSWLKSLDTSNDRMSFLVQTSLALGPALVPTFAALTPAVAGFGSALGFSVIAAGTAGLAFAGIGDGLKAMNQYALQPTAAHLEALRLAMDKIGPAGVDFIQFLRSAQPALEQLQQSAAKGLLPGLQEGMSSALTQLPLLDGIIQSTSEALGTMAREGGAALTNPFWTDFFTYLRDDAVGILTDFGSAIGHTFEGLAALMMDFGPTSNSFISALDDQAQAFSNWAQNLPETDGFQGFLAYLDKAGPMLWDTLGALGQALVDVAQAASGIGLGSLIGLEGFFKAVSAFASTPLGPVVIGILAITSAISRLVALGGILGGKTLFSGLSKGLATEIGAVGTAMAASTSKMGAFSAGAAKVKGQIAALPITLSQAIGGAVLLGAAFTDLDEKVGLSSAISFGAMGAMIGGPWGAAIGGAIGLVKDFTDANDDLNSAVTSATGIMESQPENFQATSDGIAKVRAEVDKMRTDFSGGGGWSNANPIDDIKNSIEGLFGSSDLEEAESKLKKLTDAQADMRAGVSDLRNEMLDNGSNWTDYTQDIDALTETATQAAPILDKMGLSLQDVADMHDRMVEGGQGSGEWDSFIEQFKNIGAYADSGEGQLQNFGDAVAGLNDDLLRTAESASQLTKTLSMLLDPNQALIAAQDAWSAGLRELDDNLNKHNKTLEGGSAAAEQNRATISDMVDRFQAVGDALAATGAPAKEYARTLKAMGGQLVDVGTKAGLARPQLEGFLKQIGLTPHMISVVFEAAGLEAATADAKGLAEAYNKIPKKVRLDIAANGVQANATVDSLMKKYKGLTRADAKIILRAIDAASGPIDKVKAKANDFAKKKYEGVVNVAYAKAYADIQKVIDRANDYDGMRPKADVSVDGTAGVIGEVHAAISALNIFDGMSASATMTVNHVVNEIHNITRQFGNFGKKPASGGLIGDLPVQRLAEGGDVYGYVRGPGGPKDDKVGPVMLSDKEFVTSASATAKYGSDAMYALNSLKADRDSFRKAVGMATGGMVGLARGGRRGKYLTPGDIANRAEHQDDPAEFKDLVKALNRMRKEAKDVAKAEERLHKAREQSRNASKRLEAVEKRLDKVKEHGSKAEIRRMQRVAREARKNARDAEKNERQRDTQLSTQQSQLDRAKQAWAQVRDELITQAKAAADAVLAQGDIFGGQGTSVSVGGILAKLRAAVHDGQEFNKDIRILRARGVNEDFIQQLLEQGSTPEGLAVVRNLVKASKREIGDINRLEGQLHHVSRAVGVFASNKEGHGGMHQQVTFTGDITSDRMLAKRLDRTTRQAFRLARTRA